MRAITSVTAADALRLNRKSFDNLLGRIGPGAVAKGRQGVERRIPIALLEELSLTIELNRHAAIPAREAFALARTLLGRNALDRSKADGLPNFIGSAALGPFVQLGADLQGLRADLRERLELAIESVVRQPRGRPVVARAAARDRAR